MYILVDIIKNGAQRLGGNMPLWKGKLSDKQIHDILYWVQSQWPTEIYAACYKLTRKSYKIGLLPADGRTHDVLTRKPGLMSLAIIILDIGLFKILFSDIKE
jgi:hypothetical protein